MTIFGGGILNGGLVTPTIDQLKLMAARARRAWETAKPHQKEDRAIVLQQREAELRQALAKKGSTP
jgi:hypothetical protein